MALKENQKKAIQSYISTGDPLPGDLASALDAALTNSESTASSLREQVAQIREQNRRMLLERDNTLALRLDLEKKKSEFQLKVEECVVVRTKDLTLERDRLQRGLSKLRKEIYDLREILGKLSEFVRLQAKPRFWDRLMFRRRVNDLLLDIEAFEKKDMLLSYQRGGSQQQTNQDDTSRWEKWADGEADHT